MCKIWPYALEFEALWFGNRARYLHHFWTWGASMMVLRTPEIWCSSAHSSPENCCLVGAPFWNFKFISSSLPARAAVPHQKYIRSWVKGQAWKIDSDISPIPPLIFTGGKWKVRKFTKWSITRPQIVWFRLRLVQSFITWHPIYYKCSKLMPNIRSQHETSPDHQIITLFGNRGRSI